MPFSGTPKFAVGAARMALGGRIAAWFLLVTIAGFGWTDAIHAQTADGPDAATKAAMERRTSARTNLSSALSRIAANGSDFDALLNAGRASIILEDYRSALAFLVRAEQISPRSGLVQAALGSAVVRMEKPQRALDYFAQAQLQGAPERLFLSDRALARDLMGQQAQAQRDYQLALSLAPDAETTRRYALSLGITGETDRAVTLLVPQLREQDRGAWRTRALILAMNGRNSEAIDIVKATMPPSLATSIIPYLVQMDRLTPVQQAAAAHFGRFPSDQQAAARAPQQVAVVATPPAAVVRQATPTPKPAPPPAANPAPSAAEKPPAAVPDPVPPSAPIQMAAASPTPPSTVQGPAETGAAIGPGFSIAAIGSSSPPSAAGATTTGDAAAAPALPSGLSPSTGQPAAAPPTTLADIFKALEIPPEELVRPNGALDAAMLDKLQADNRRAVAAEAARAEKEAAAAKAKAESEAEAKAEAAKKKAHPARQWVQIATGSPVSALAFDYRKFAREFAASFKGQSGYTAEWGRTHRLLVGPFKSGKAADAWLSAYKKAGGDGFTFDSAAGETVEPLK